MRLFDYEHCAHALNVRDEFTSPCIHEELGHIIKLTADNNRVQHAIPLCEILITAFVFVTNYLLSIHLYPVLLPFSKTPGTKHPKPTILTILAP